MNAVSVMSAVHVALDTDDFFNRLQAERKYKACRDAHNDERGHGVPAGPTRMLPEVDVRAVVKTPHGAESLPPSSQRSAQMFDVQDLRCGHAIYRSPEVPDSSAVVRVDEVPEPGIEVPNAL